MEKIFTIEFFATYFGILIATVIIAIILVILGKILYEINKD